MNYESALQNALRSGKTPEDLESELSIKWKRHPKYSNLIIFTYNQIDSPKLNPIVMSSRGHILDENDNWRHVCRPFDRFLNFGENNPSYMDFSKSIFFKKEDGSLLNLWFYDGEWQVSTKGSPDASGSVGTNNFTFKELFKNVFNSLGYKDPIDCSETLSFELCTKYNKVVCHQLQERIVLIGARNNETGIEFKPSEKNSLGYEICKEYVISNLDDAVKSFDEFSGTEFEGYVAAQFMEDGSVRRNKIKNPKYVIIHHLKEGISQKKILDLIRSGENEEFLTYFPEYEAEFNLLKDSFEKIVFDLNELWLKTKNISDQKDFALSIKESKLSSVLFKIRKNGGSIKEHLNAINIDLLYSSIK
jgi:hypothetical protein